MDSSSKTKSVSRTEKRKHEESNETYYKQQVVLHVPWRNEADIKQEDQTWEKIFKNYNLDELVKTTCKLGDDTNDKEDDANEYESEDDSDDEETTLTEEFLSSRLGPQTI